MTNKKLVYKALAQWRNRIQTGDPDLSTEDAIATGQVEKCRMLNSDQQDFIVRLEESMADVLAGDFKI